MANRIELPTLEQARPECMLCEQMLTDALDETLTAADQDWFDRHTAGCAVCGQRLAEAKQGAAWLDVLKMSAPPEPSADLVARILAQTSEARDVAGAHAAAESLPAFEKVGPSGGATIVPAAQGKLIPFRVRRPVFSGITRIVFEPRLAMTAAMAFFSIALTLNLLGVRLDELHPAELHASDLRPENLRRSFFAVQASAVRSYDNLRVVHVLESRVEDLREAADPQSAYQEEQRDGRPGAPAYTPGSALRPDPSPRPDDPAAPSQQDKLQTPPLPELPQQAAPGMSRRGDETFTPSRDRGSMLQPAAFAQPARAARSGRMEGRS